MPANVDTMAYHGEVPWHGLGQQVPKGVTSAEMIRAAGLDWVVVKRPARGAKPIPAPRNRPVRYPRYEIVRMPRPKTDEEEVVLGIVTNRYEPLQNREAFDFFDPIVLSSEAYFETAGSLGQGERVWCMTKMPDAIKVVRGDECMKYLLLSNTHNGQGSVTVKFTAVRVVCQNTLMLAMDDGQKALRVRHSRLMTRRLAEVSGIIATATSIYEQTAELFQRMAAVSLTATRLNEYLNMVFPRTEMQKQEGSRPERWGYIRKIFEEQEDLQMDGVRGTLWAAYNAITRFEDYRNLREDETDDERLDRVWFGGGADIKLKALSEAKELLKLGLN
jgi:phage/plasmid-like protein (TIGR03299 family)